MARFTWLQSFSLSVAKNLVLTIYCVRGVSADWNGMTLRSSFSVQLMNLQPLSALENSPCQVFRNANIASYASRSAEREINHKESYESPLAFSKRISGRIAPVVRRSTLIEN